MECPKCKQKEIFRLDSWELNSGRVYVRIDKDGNYEIEDYKDTECCISGFYPNGLTRCGECRYEGDAVFFDNGSDYIDYSPEPMVGIGNLPLWKRLILKSIGISLP